MKITPTSHPQSMPSGKPASVQKQSTSNFQKVFDKAISSAGHAESASSAMMYPSGPSALSLQTIDPLNANRAIEVMDRFLDVLDTYRQALANPRASLRELEPDMKRLEREHHRLSRLVETPNLDRPLLDIMNEGLVTASIEIHRFHSGHYC